LFSWIDLFAMHQHPGPKKSADLASLKDVIKTAKRGTFMVQRSGTGEHITREMQALTRMW